MLAGYAKSLPSQLSYAAPHLGLSKHMAHIHQSYVNRGTSQFPSSTPSELASSICMASERLEDQSTHRCQVIRALFDLTRSSWYHSYWAPNPRPSISGM